MEENTNNTKEQTKVEDTNKKVEEKNVKKSNGKKIRVILTLVVVALYALYTAFSIRAQYLNYMQVGENYVSVLYQNLSNRYFVFGIAFVATFIFTIIVNRFIFKGLKKFFNDEKKQMPKFPNKSIALIFSLISATIAMKFLGDRAAIFSNAGYFGQTDPIFNNDIGYYMFQIPFLQSLCIFIIAACIVALAYVGLYFVIVLNNYFEGVDGNTLKKNTFIKLELFLAFVLILALCGYIFINSQNIMTGNMLKISDEDSTYLAGASLSDATIKVWGYRLLIVVILIFSIRAIRKINKENYKQGIISLFAIPVYLVGMFIVMLVFNVAYVDRNELDTEKEYISYNINNTKVAYGIDIDQKSIDNYSEITKEQVTNNSEVIDNVPFVTKDVTQTTISEHQENSVYYSYENTFLATYKVNGINRLMYITPREILTDSSISYNNKTLTYTHGYSLVANYASEVDTNGYTKYLLSDFTNQETLNITEPRIYFGLNTDSIIETNTSYGKEYDYPLTASTNEENTYDGEAGQNLGFIDRLILGVSEGNFRLAFSKNITDDTKIISNRNIIERAKVVFPDVFYDENPYLVITNEGKLVWVLDGYTRSCAYPYSEVTTVNIKGYKEKINYIRNSVKVLIDAYDGTTTFYITDKTDPIIMTYRNMYPDLFSDEAIPQDIQEHIVYPEFLYSIQAEMINKYHDVSADTLYRADDIWEISSKASSTNSKVVGSTMEPYYTMLKTKDSKEEKLGLMLTYNKLGKQNITSYLVGSVENGKNTLSLYKFSSESNVVGIMQLNNQIDQDETIAKELDALNTSGTKLIKDMIIVPINNTLLYVEPVYQVMLNESEIPVLKKIIVASGNTVAIGDTLESAIDNLLSDDNSVDLEIVNTDDINAIIDSVIKANKNLTESINSNDLEMMGKDITSLQSLVNQLEVARQNEIEKEKQLEAENAAETENVNEVDSNTVVNETTDNTSITNKIQNVVNELVK